MISVFVRKREHQETIVSTFRHQESFSIMCLACIALARLGNNREWYQDESIYLTELVSAHRWR
jgi:hypothetical protein